VLCGALRKPTGVNFRLLQLAPDGVVLDGFTTEVAGMEFVRNALEGLSGVRSDIELIEEFLDAFGALFDPTTLPNRQSVARSRSRRGCTTSRSARSSTT
jgi:hypothetical protein